MTPKAMAAIPDTGRPAVDEYAPFYETYVGLVPETAIDAVLDVQLGRVVALVEGLTEAEADYRYAEGKWSVRELIGHLIDAEWVFANRAIWFARGNPGPMPGMDQDDFAAAAGYDRVSLTTLVQQFTHIRSAGLMQYRAFSEATLNRRGIASDCEFTVRGLLYILAGHVRHHLRMLEERYFITGPR